MLLEKLVLIHSILHFHTISSYQWYDTIYMWYQNRKLCKSKYPHLVSPISWLERNEIDWPTFALKVEAQEVEVPRTGWLSHYYWCPCSEWGGNPVSLHFWEHPFPKCKQPFPPKHWSGLGWISKSFLPDSWSLLSLTLLLLTRFRLVRIETPAPAEHCHSWNMITQFSLQRMSYAHHFHYPLYHVTQ